MNQNLYSICYSLFMNMLYFVNASVNRPVSLILLKIESWCSVQFIPHFFYKQNAATTTNWITLNSTELLNQVVKWLKMYRFTCVAMSIQSHYAIFFYLIRLLISVQEMINHFTAFTLIWGDSAYKIMPNYDFQLKKTSLVQCIT